jgi:hypothetical protein
MRFLKSIGIGLALVRLSTSVATKRLVRHGPFLINAQGIVHLQADTPRQVSLLLLATLFRETSYGFGWGLSLGR